MSGGRPRLLLDTPSLYYRAFFALPRSILSPAGRPVNAVRGYLDMVTWLIRAERPRALVHCFDVAWRPAWRVAAWPQYKQLRSTQEEPPELAGQPELIRAFLLAAGQVVAGAEDHEADDVLAALAAAATDAEPDHIVTGDRDLLQLVRDHAVVVRFTVKGVSELTHFDEAEVRRKYGVAPDRYADFAILRGDSSDGLPGVRGVGERTAADLIRMHGSVAELMAAPISGRVGDALVAQRDYLEAMLRIVPLSPDVPVQLEGGGPVDTAELQRLGVEHGLENAVARLLEVLPLLDEPTPGGRAPSGRRAAPTARRGAGGNL